MKKQRLLDMAAALNIPVEPEMPCRMLAAVIGKHNATEDTLPQIPVMLAQNFADLSDAEQDEILESGDWVAEEKINGVRQRLHIGEHGCRLDSRRRSDKTCLFMERTENFPRLQGCLLPGFEGTIFDGELVSDTLPHMTAMCTALPAKSLELQAAIGKPRFVVFDLIVWNGKVLEDTPFGERSGLLTVFFAAYSRPLRDAKIELVPQSNNPFDLYAKVAARGGEGIMLKETRQGYSPGRRVEHVLKWKFSETIEAVITGGRPGTAGSSFEGMVGSVEVKATGITALGAVQPPSLDMREDMSGPGGALHPVYCGRKIKVRHMGVTSAGRLKHAVFAGFVD